MTKKNVPQRVNAKLIEDMERILGVRLRKGLMDRRDAKMPKITGLLTRTEGYKISLRELETKPERKKNE